MSGFGCLQGRRSWGVGGAGGSVGLRGRDTIRKVRGGEFRLSLRQKLLWTEMRPPQIHVGAGASRSNWLEAGPCDGVSVRIRRNTRELSLSLSPHHPLSPPPTHSWTQQEGGRLQAGRRGLPRARSCQRPDLGLLASGTMGFRISSLSALRQKFKSWGLLSR